MRSRTVPSSRFNLRAALFATLPFTFFCIPTVSHRPDPDTSLWRFKLHYYRNFTDRAVKGGCCETIVKAKGPIRGRAPERLTYLSQKYYPTLLRRICAETWRFGTEQVIVVLLAIAALALQIRYGLVRRGDWKPSVLSMLWPYVCLMLSFIVYQFLRVPKLLYTELQTTSRSTEESLRAAIAERDNSLRALTDKPKRTAAEQHHYDKAKETLKKFGPAFADALRLLKTHGKLTFGFYPPQLPPGVRADELQRIYIACLGEGLVTKHEKPGSGGEDV